VQRTKPREDTASKDGVDGQGEEGISSDCKDQHPPWVHPFPRYDRSHAAGPQELDLKTFRDQMIDRALFSKGDLTTFGWNRVGMPCWPVLLAALGRVEGSRMTSSLSGRISHEGWKRRTRVQR
jgi:hypothetical protein